MLPEPPHGMQVINILNVGTSTITLCSITPKSSNCAYNRQVHMYISSFHNWERLRRQACVCICCRVLHLLLWTGSDSRSCVSNAQCGWNKLHLYSARVRAAWWSFFWELWLQAHPHFFWLFLAVLCLQTPHLAIRSVFWNSGLPSHRRHRKNCQPFHMRSSDSRRKGLQFLRLGSAGCCQSP